MVNVKPFFVSDTDPPKSFVTWKEAQTYELAEAIKGIIPAGMIEDADLLDAITEKMALDIVHEDPEASKAWDKFTEIARQMEPLEAPPTIPFEHSPKPSGGLGLGRLSGMLKSIPETKNSRLPLREVPK